MKKTGIRQQGRYNPAALKLRNKNIEAKTSKNYCNNIFRIKEGRQIRETILAENRIIMGESAGYGIFLF